MGTDDTPDVEGVEAVGGQAGSQSDDTGPAEGGGYMNIGGLASKPKRKKQKKMKRGGLASR